MAKGKSSASSGTRKKHARRAAGTGNDGNAGAVVIAPSQKDKKQKGKGKKIIEPRKKAYVAPYKPPPVQQDPLDSLGIAHRLPGTLVVVLRRLGKKDEVTKGKALEELQADWVERAPEAPEEGEDAVGTMLPVWVRNTPCVRRVHPISYLFLPLYFFFSTWSCTMLLRSSYTLQDAYGTSP
jgi:hypothetical protein